jgi:threonine/homoserine/homoserine lactone efflux protein
LGENGGMDGIVGFVLAGVALAGSPGPATLSLAAAGAAFGTRGGLAYMAGIIFGMLAVMVMTAAGVMGLVLAVPGAAPVLLAAAALYFCYLALRIAAAPPLAAAGEGRRPPSFAGGFLLSLINPKGYAAMAALFSGFVLIGERLALDAAAKIAILALIIAAVDLAWLFAGAALTRAFRAPRLSRFINIAFALLLVASLLLALLF